jgi:hypothetical protein
MATIAARSTIPTANAAWRPKPVRENTKAQRAGRRPVREKTKAQRAGRRPVRENTKAQRAGRRPVRENTKAPKCLRARPGFISRTRAEGLAGRARAGAPSGAVCIGSGKARSHVRHAPNHESE